MNMKRTYKSFLIYGLIVFAGLLVYFTFINPLTIYDADDWFYVSQLRKPVPNPHEYNPIKVFPETFMPLVSYFGALIIKPIIHNYYKSLTLAHGLFASCVITLYFVEFVIMFYKRKFSTLRGSITSGLLFILFHIVSYINKGHNNSTILSALNVTYFYNYTLAAVINATLVMHFISYGGVHNWYKKSSIPHKILAAIWMYFSINSNLFSSVILASYIGAELLLNLINDLRSKQFQLKSYCLNHWVHLLIIICWFISNLIETTGGRASDMHKNVLLNIPSAFIYTIGGFVSANIFFILLEIIVFFLWIKKYKASTTSIRFILYIGLQLLYILLLSAAAEPFYASRVEVVIANYFYVFIALIACFNQLITVNKKYVYLPLILCGTVIILFIQPGRILAPYNYSFLSYSQCEALTNDYINQFQQAQKQTKDEIELVIPKFNSESNWPLTSYIENRIPLALKRHRVLDTYIPVKKRVLSDEKNKQYNISPDR